jgi:hypothetical protein
MGKGKEEVQMAKTYKKILTIPAIKGNANQNHIKSLPQLLLEWLSSITQTMTNVGQYAGKKEPSYTDGGNVS